MFLNLVKCCKYINNLLQNNTILINIKEWNALLLLNFKLERIISLNLKININLSNYYLYILPLNNFKYKSFKIGFISKK